MSKRSRLHLRLRVIDRERLELIRDTLGISLSGAFRASLVAMTRQLGFEKEFSEDLLKKK